VRKLQNYFILIGLVAIVGCGESEQQIAEKQMLIAKVDSLQLIADNNLQAMRLIDQVGVFLDSIEAQRKWVKIDLEAGMSGEDYLTRMSKLADYMERAEKKIGELEKTRSGYASQTKRLKAELEVKNQEIADLRNMVEKVTQENVQLSNKLKFTETDLEEASLSLEARIQELALLEARLEGLIKASKISEAESYFQRGQAMEEVASRTQLAPKRKKEALTQALTFYQKSLDMGYTSAEEKVISIKSKLKI
jgi:predicted  nucleic acid-binding Zn-ribbon protein